MLKVACRLIENHPTRQIHQGDVADRFPDYCPETIKRRVQELAKEGILARLGKGYYTIPDG